MGSAVTASCACGLETTVMIGASLLDQADPAIIVGVVSTSGREIHDQPGHQVLDDGIGGMGFGELLQVMGVFELQHCFAPPAFSPGIKKPAEAGSEGCIYKESVGGFFRG